MKIILELDPGHGGYDSGGTHNNILEKNRNLETVYAVKKMLEKTGEFDVRLTRTDDTFIGLKERAEKSNQDKAVLFISFHYNMAPERYNAKGYEIYHYPKSVHGIEFATLLSKEFDKVGLTKRFVGSGMRCDSSKGNYTVIQETETAAILIEPEFLNNPEIKDWTPEKVARPVVNAILKYFDIEIIPQIEEWKLEIFEMAYMNGLVTDREWINKLDEKMDVWAVMAMINNRIKKGGI